MAENMEMVMDMETKNQQFDQDVEEMLGLLEESNYFKAREIVLNTTKEILPNCWRKFSMN